MNRRMIFVVVTALFLTALCSVDACADKSLEDKIDSLFVVASALDIKYKDSVEVARDSIAAMGTEAVPHLIDLLETPHGRERAALEAIFKKIGEKAVPQLNAALLDTDSLRLSRVARILVFFPDTSSVTNLLQIVDNPYYSARYQAIRALGEIGDLRAVPAIRTALKDTNELVRTIAVVSAGRLETPDLFPDMMVAFNDDYYGGRMSAHEALKKAACEDKTGFINGVLAEASPEAQKHLLAIIAEDTCRYDFENIRPFLKSDDLIIRSLALRAAFKTDSKFTADYMKSLPDTTDHLLYRQTIRELTECHETKTSANP